MGEVVEGWEKWWRERRRRIQVELSLRQSVRSSSRVDGLVLEVDETSSVGTVQGKRIERRKFMKRRGIEKEGLGKWEVVVKRGGGKEKEKGHQRR